MKIKVISCFIAALTLCLAAAFLLCSFQLTADGAIGGGGAGGAGDQSLVFSVLSSADGQMYMRLKSFGDYDGQRWGEAQEYTQWLDGAYSMNYLTGIALEYSGRSAATAKISSATSAALASSLSSPIAFAQASASWATTTE